MALLLKFGEISIMVLSKSEMFMHNAEYFKISGLIHGFITYVDGKSECLICMRQISVVMEYNIVCYYDSHHSDKF